MKSIIKQNRIRNIVKTIVFTVTIIFFTGCKEMIAIAFLPEILFANILMAVLPILLIGGIVLAIIEAIFNRKDKDK